MTDEAAPPPRKPNSISGKLKTKMFGRYLEGMSYAAIGREFSVSRTRVNQIAQEQEWRRHAGDHLKRAYARLAEVELKRVGIVAAAILDKHMQRLFARIDSTPNLELSSSEWREIRQTLDAIRNDQRLSDHEPTEIVGGTVVTEIHLRPGVKRYGVDPPGPNVKIIEHKPAAPEESKPRTVLDELESDGS